MIHVTRSEVPAPPELTSDYVTASMESAEKFYRTSRRLRSQRRLELSFGPIRGPVRNAVTKLFHGKCCYCERSVSTEGTKVIDHFRPRRHTIGLGGEIYIDHYWWLFFTWENLFFACSQCNKMKGNRFPIAGPRAEMLADPKSLAEEKPLLLNPCEEDPCEHLEFIESGQVLGLTERGKLTIETIGLNREDLVASRYNEWSTLERLWRASQLRIHPDLAKQWVKVQLSQEQPFLGLRRAFANQRFTQDGLDDPKIKASLLKYGVKVGFEHVRGGPAEDTVQAYSVDSENWRQKEEYFSKLKTIKRVEISNFKGIASLQLFPPETSSKNEAWMMLLGENGTGKSSILQAITLALIGQKKCNRLGLDAREFVRKGATEGHVEIQLTNAPTVKLTFNLSRRSFRIEPREALVLLLGFGATRLLPRSRHAQDPRRRRSTVNSLFNPFSRLNHAERWLVDRSAVNDDRFNRIAIALKRLLLLNDEDQLSRDEYQVWVKMRDKKIGLAELSDGYQSVVVMVVNIIMGIVVKWKEMDVAEGVVLVDELETHLHPIWKMKIVALLREVFPKLMFIATTHDPLCLRGLNPGEIFVLRRHDDEIKADPVTEPIDHLRADQLLTSPLFGLVGTRDPRISGDIDRYSELLGKTRNAVEEEEFATLGAQLGKQLNTAESPAGQIVESTFQRAFEEIVLPELQAKIAGLEDNPVAINQARTTLATMLSGVNI